MRNDFGTRPYKSRFPYSKDTEGKRVKAKQGYYAREDESIGMRLGKGKGTAKERDMSYGKWGKRGKDWAKSGKMIKAAHGTMVTGGTAYVKTKLNGTLKTRTF